MQLAATDPVLHQTLALPKNQEFAKKVLGLDVEIAGADSWNKQMVEINLLLAEPPQIVQPPPLRVPNPLMPEQIEEIPQGPQLQASIPIDPDWDDNAAEYITVKIWVNGKDGQKAKQENAPGFKNVQLHGDLHKQELAKQMQAQQPPPAPPQPPAPSIHFHAGGAPKAEAPAGSAPAQPAAA